MCAWSGRKVYRAERRVLRLRRGALQPVNVTLMSGTGLGEIQRDWVYTGWCNGLERARQREVDFLPSRIWCGRTLATMFQIELKLHLVEKLFNPASGWSVTVDIDAMEMAKGGQQPPDKVSVAKKHRKCLYALGVTIGEDGEFGRADIVARHPIFGTYIVEVEGDTRRQKEQAMYSALGQLVVNMKEDTSSFHYMLAVPDDPVWERQLVKIPQHLLALLDLKLLLVGSEAIRQCPE